MDKRALREAKLEGKRKDKEDVGKDDGGAHTEMSKYEFAELRMVPSS